jgi:hypothetical protein
MKAREYRARKKAQAALFDGNSPNLMMAANQ